MFGENGRVKSLQYIMQSCRSTWGMRWCASSTL